MTRLSTTICTAFLFGAACRTVAADAALSVRMAEYDKLFRLQKRALEIKPRRRDGPARYLGITDVEVEEIIAASPVFLTRNAVNIGPVVTGCPCEDGPKCEDQVWVVAQDSATTVELLFSRIDKHWTIGPVQQWWLNHAELERLDREANPPRAYWRKVEAHYYSLPVCAVTSEATIPSLRTTVPAKK